MRHSYLGRSVVKEKGGCRYLGGSLVPQSNNARLRTSHNYVLVKEAEVQNATESLALQFKRP